MTATPTDAGLGAELQFALILADQADSLTLPGFRGGVEVRTKGDGTPVTEVDRGTEDQLRAAIKRQFPSDAIYGEEYGEERGTGHETGHGIPGETRSAGAATGQGSRRWVINPIDGTKNFVRSIPVWATLIGLLVDGDPVLGVVSAPALGRRWWAARGLGAFASDDAGARPVTVSTVDDLSAAAVSHSSLAGWEEQGRLDGFLELTRRVSRLRGFGDFWSYMLVAEGAVEVAAEPEVELYDLAAVAAVVVEAGGTFTALDGTPGPAGGSAVATNGRVHQQVLDLLDPSSSAGPQLA